MFATTPFAKGQRIATYVGEVIPRKDVPTRYGPNNNAPYVLEADDVQRLDIDAASVRGIASMANGSYGLAAGRGNAMFVGSRSQPLKPYIVAERDIEAGEEIIVDYGPDYFPRLRPRCRPLHATFKVKSSPENSQSQ